MDQLLNKEIKRMRGRFDSFSPSHLLSSNLNSEQLALGLGSFYLVRQ